MKLFQALSFVLCFGLVYPTEWRFGVDSGDQTTNVGGHISLFTHKVNIPLKVPPCRNTTFVHVKVDNKLATPEVTYDKSFNTVEIRYKWYQSSASTYQVLAKSQTDLYCTLKNDASRYVSQVK